MKSELFVCFMTRKLLDWLQSWNFNADNDEDGDKDDLTADLTFRLGLLYKRRLLCFICNV